LKRWIIYFVILILNILFINSCASGHENPIVLSGTHPVMANQYIVFTGTLDKESIDSGETLYYYDMMTNNTSEITSIPENVGTTLDISGSILVWENLGDIWMYNITSKMMQKITSDVYIQERPKISGNTIVWYERQNDNSYVKGFSIVNAEYFTLTNNISSGPSIDGEIVAWIDKEMEVEIIHLSSREIIPITNTSHSVNNPFYHPMKTDVQIDRSNIIWLDYRNNNTSLDGTASIMQLIQFNITTGIQTQVTNNNMYIHSIDIYGNIIVWGASNSYLTEEFNTTIYTYNINDNSTRELTCPSNSERYVFPSIYENKIAFVLISVDSRDPLTIRVYDISNEQYNDLLLHLDIQINYGYLYYIIFFIVIICIFIFIHYYVKRKQ